MGAAGLDPRLSEAHRAAVDRYNRSLPSGNESEIRAASDALLTDINQRIITDDRYIPRTRGARP